MVAFGAMAESDEVSRRPWTWPPAIERRDVRALTGALAPGFLYRTPGGQPLDEETFLKGIAEIPGEIVFVRLVDLGSICRRRGRWRPVSSMPGFESMGRKSTTAAHSSIGSSPVMASGRYELPSIFRSSPHRLRRRCSKASPMFTLDQVVPWGRSFDEYRRMFALTDADLGLKILGCGDGPASFNAEATRRGATVISCDPIYRFDADHIRGRIAITYEQILEQTRQNIDDFRVGFDRLCRRARSHSHGGDAGLP